MSFGDSIDVLSLTLGSRITVQDEDRKGVWVTGRVIRLSLLDEGERVAITLLLDNGSGLLVHRRANDSVTIEWNTKEN